MAPILVNSKSFKEAQGDIEIIETSVCRPAFFKTILFQCDRYSNPLAFSGESEDLFGESQTSRINELVEVIILSGAQTWDNQDEVFLNAKGSKGYKSTIQKHKWAVWNVMLR